MRAVSAEIGSVLLLIGSVWLSLCVVAVSLCVAARRGDEALTALTPHTAAPPEAEPDVPFVATLTALVPVEADPVAAPAPSLPLRSHAS
ncbi:hypothetical protein C8N24_3368 [Solirubrobacter pauli]|uniref:Uncharacterized protein n=1 Tax=Solirubrobacter pauli TaxID=166793 RepID=A0A660LHP4_9ACTN|nr:hypothetical protein C8N24_3368 [Solirubrobacter pauli]